jgi:beta-lactamase class A
MHRIAQRRLISPAVSEQLDRWLATNVDLSMVAAGINLDPLAHVEQDRGYLLRNKTGTDNGIRADIGYLTKGRTTLAYAVLANWDAKVHDSTDDVMNAMRGIGSALALGLAPGNRT